MMQYLHKMDIMLSGRFNLSLDLRKPDFAHANTKAQASLSSLISSFAIAYLEQGSHRFEKYLNLEGFLEKSLKIKSAMKSTGKSLKSLEKSLNSTMFCMT